MKRFALIAIIVILTMAAAPQAVNAQKSWDQVICDGNEAVVWRATSATTTNMPKTEGCKADSAKGWVVLEPWTDDPLLNVNRSCLAMTWQEAVDFTSRNKWLNGSAWRVENAGVVKNPVVVLCSSVKVPEDMGLTLGDQRIYLPKLAAYVERYNTLTSDMPVDEYAKEWPSKLAENLTILKSLGVSGLK